MDRRGPRPDGFGELLDRSVGEYRRRPIGLARVLPGSAPAAPGAHRGQRSPAPVRKSGLPPRVRRWVAEPWPSLVRHEGLRESRSGRASARPRVSGRRVKSAPASARRRFPRVLAGNAQRRQRGHEPIQVLQRHVDRWESDDLRAHRLLEIDAHATSPSAGKGEVVVPQAQPNADRGDPQPRALDLPRGDIGHRSAHVEPAEAHLKLVADLDERVLGPDAVYPEREPRAAADADRETGGRHSGVRVPEVAQMALAC